MPRARSAFRNWTLEYWIALAVVNRWQWTPCPVANGWRGATPRLLDRALPRLRRVARAQPGAGSSGTEPARHPRIIDGVFRSIARLLVTFARFPRIDRGNVGEWIRYEGFEHFEARPQTRPRRAVRHRAPGQLGAERVRARAAWRRPCTWWCGRSTIR